MTSHDDSCLYWSMLIWPRSISSIVSRKNDSLRRCTVHVFVGVLVYSSVGGTSSARIHTYIGLLSVPYRFENDYFCD